MIYGLYPTFLQFAELLLLLVITLYSFLPGRLLSMFIHYATTLFSRDSLTVN
jgi:hypothetical protein